MTDIDGVNVKEIFRVTLVKLTGRFEK